MNILLVGASGTVGQAVAKELEKTHTIIRAGRNGADVARRRDKRTKCINSKASR